MPPAAEAPLTIDTFRRPVARGSSADGLATTLTLATLVLTAVAIAGYVAWPRLRELRQVGQRPERPRHPAVATAPPAVQEPAPAGDPPERSAKPEPEGEPGERPRRPRRRPPRETPPAAANPDRPDPEPAPPKPAPPKPAPPKPAPPEPAPPPVVAPPPPVDHEKIRRQVGDAVAKTYAAVRRGDLAAATRHLESVAAVAGDDGQAADRLALWRQFLVYAKAYPEYRDRALVNAASSSRNHQIGSRQIGVIEFNDKLLVYRDSQQAGRNLRVPRDAIPTDIERVIVGTWFANDGRAANHLFLGAAALARRVPDPDWARSELAQAANQGEPHGTLLLGLLDDPVVRNPRPLQ